jgi:hypothetical protein
LTLSNRLHADAPLALQSKEMSEPIVARVPVVAGLAYVERLRRQPSSFVATLVLEPDNRYMPHAIAVTVAGEKLGYLAPEVAWQYRDVITAASAPVTCQARRGSLADHETSGVELLLDFSGISGAV